MLKYCSEYKDFSMFLTEFKVGSEAIVFDKDAEASVLCKIVDIQEHGHADGDYEGEFVIPDGTFMVGVNVIRPENYPNEFEPLIKEFFKSKTGFYC